MVHNWLIPRAHLNIFTTSPPYSYVHSLPLVLDGLAFSRSLGLVVRSRIGQVFLLLLGSSSSALFAHARFSRDFRSFFLFFRESSSVFASLDSPWPNPGRGGESYAMLCTKHPSQKNNEQLTRCYHGEINSIWRLLVSRPENSPLHPRL